MYLNVFEDRSIPDEETISLNYLPDRLLYSTIRTAMETELKRSNQTIDLCQHSPNAAQNGKQTSNVTNTNQNKSPNVAQNRNQSPNVAQRYSCYLCCSNDIQRTFQIGFSVVVSVRLLTFLYTFYHPQYYNVKIFYDFEEIHMS